MKNHLKLLMAAILCLGGSDLMAQYAPASLHLPHGVFPDSNKNCQPAGTLSSAVGQLYAKAVANYNGSYHTTVVPVGPGGQIDFPSLPIPLGAQEYYIYVNKNNNPADLSPLLPTGWSYTCSAGNGAPANFIMTFTLSPGNNTYPAAGIGIYSTSNIKIAKFVYNDVSRACNYSTGVGTSLGGSLYCKAKRIGQLNGQTISRAGLLATDGTALFDTLPPGPYRIWIDNNNNPADTVPTLPAGWLFTCNGTNSITTNYGILNTVNVTMGGLISFSSGIGIYNPAANQDGTAQVEINSLVKGPDCSIIYDITYGYYGKLVPLGAIFASNVYYFSTTGPSQKIMTNVKPGSYKMIYSSTSGYNDLTEFNPIPGVWTCQSYWNNTWSVVSGSNNYIYKYGVMGQHPAAKIAAPAAEDVVRLLSNPVSDIAHLQISVSAGAHLSIVVTNMLSQQVLHKELNLDKGSFLEALDVSNLSAGSYILSVRGTTLNQTIRFIKN